MKLLPLLCLLLAGCANTITLPKPPKWVDPQAPNYTAAEVRAVIAQASPGATIDTSDSAFTPVDHDWLLAMVAWSDTFLRVTGHVYTPESFDCDKFAVAFALGVNWVAGDAGVKAQPLVARIFVAQTKAFGGVAGAPATSHALIAFRSNRGIFVLEPQPTGAVRLIALADYPNPILRVKLGG